MAEIESINGNQIVAEVASESIQPSVDAWLAAHPEATTTVQDNSITNAKLVQTGGILSVVIGNPVTITRTGSGGFCINYVTEAGKTYLITNKSASSAFANVRVMAGQSTTSQAIETLYANGVNGGESIQATPTIGGDWLYFYANGAIEIEIANMDNHDASIKALEATVGTAGAKFPYADAGGHTEQYQFAAGHVYGVVNASQSSRLVFQTYSGSTVVDDVVSSGLDAGDAVEFTATGDATSFYVYLNGAGTAVLFDNVNGAAYQAAIAAAKSSALQARDNAFNSAQFPPTFDWESPAREFAALYAGAGTSEAFCFFTDQHLYGTHGSYDEANLERYITSLQKVYNSSPCAYIVNGGDWLNNTDSAASACFELGYMDGFMRSMFHDYHPVLGNHDTNYQGEAELTEAAIKNLLFHDEGDIYYSFDGMSSKCYVLSTWNSGWLDLNRGYEQLNWLCSKLEEDDAAHSVIFMHIITDNGELCAMADLLGSVVSAYNSRSSVNVNGTAHSFASCTGRVELIVGGHTHSDATGILGGVRYIITTNFTNSNKPTFDLMLADYSNRVLHAVRVGAGSSRTINLAQ